MLARLCVWIFSKTKPGISFLSRKAVGIVESRTWLGETIRNKP